MPSQITHLAIAKRFLVKHPREISDVQTFLDGNVFPDLAPDKAKAHCGIRSEFHDLVKRNLEKVNPAKFAAENDMSSDFNKGHYLHLYVDYQFYNYFLADYFRSVTIEQSSKDIFETSRRDDNYLREKYGVSFADSTMVSELRKINDLWDQEVAEQRRNPEYKFTFPYQTEELDQFIEKMAQVTIPQN